MELFACKNNKENVDPCTGLDVVQESRVRFSKKPRVPLADITFLVNNAYASTALLTVRTKHCNLCRIKYRFLSCENFKFRVWSMRNSSFRILTRFCRYLTHSHQYHNDVRLACFLHLVSELYEHCVKSVPDRSRRFPVHYHTKEH